MPKSFNDLTAEQQAAFWADVKRWGLEESDVVAESNTGHLRANACISSIPTLSNIKTKPFTLRSLEHMKEMVGIPDALFASGKMRDQLVSYPEDLPAARRQWAAHAPDSCALKYSLTEDEHEVLKQAWLAYLVGDSSKVSAEMVSMINLVHFPAVVAVAAVQDINVASGTVYTFGTPDDQSMQVIPIGVLNIEAGGSIAFAAPCTLQCQATQAASPGARADSLLADQAPANNINIYSPAPPPPATPPAQPPKGKANNATPGGIVPIMISIMGQQYQVGTTCDPSNPSVAASDGDTGYGGTTGTNGQKGVSPPPVVAYLGVVTGTYNFMAGGGNGQDGGKGGDAGQGGEGGDGVAGSLGSGKASVNPVNCANQGPGKGGLGGTGGAGGVPGDGAIGSTSYFFYTSIQQPFSYNIETVGGFGGQPGLGGAAGSTGAGGADPAGVMGSGYNAADYNLGPGSNGPTGNNGNPGANADPGVIYFQLKAG